MSKALVSVIVPIYNNKKYLPRCVESILTQSYENLEVILVDDGSTDGCSEMMDAIAAADKRVVVIHQENGGQSRARNVGIEIAHGEFLSFVDGDDEIAENFVEELVEHLDADAAISVCGMHYKWLSTGDAKNVYINPLRAQRAGERIESYIPFLLTIDGRMYSSVNKLYRAEIVKKHKVRFQEDLNFAEDTKFVLDYLKKSTGKISFVLKPLYIYNYGTETSTIKKTGTSWKNWQRSYETLKKWVGKNPSAAEKFWLAAVLARWRVSYLKSKI